MSNAQIEIEVLSSLNDVPVADWDACASGGSERPPDPFVTHRFLKALEDSGSVGPGTGWDPHYLIARLEGKVIACTPLYGKSHSQGEYVFDHNWAHAYEQAGGQYYPKLQIAVPFTPATGRRFLVREGFDGVGYSALVQGAVQLAKRHGLSSLHVTFCTEEEAKTGQQMGLMLRTGQQFHWENRGFTDFDAFLSDLNSRKRKNIRKERARAQSFGGNIVMLSGDDICPEHWDAFWRFYQDTGARKWGRPYLTRAFFECIQDTMRNDVVLALAIRDGIPIAGALNFIGAETLFGRYWGCTEDHPCLHFELCYYRAIEWAIAHGLSRVEAGAQGEHKLARGYLPSATHSLHWISDPGFAQAVETYLDAERTAVEEDIEVLTSYGPFRKAGVEERE